MSVPADVEPSRTRFTVTHRPADRRCNWTYLPANERAASTFVENLLPDSARMLTSGRTPTVICVLAFLPQVESNTVRIVGCAVYVQVPPTPVLTSASLTN